MKARSRREGDPERSVFINCPFDADYQRFFDAIVFVTTACGYTPRCALERENTSVPRIERIFDALNSSKYSIHDFSRCKGEGDENLARFNMPLEFGIAFGKGYLKTDDGRRLHDWLVLMPNAKSYQAVVSDLGAYDLQPYNTGTVDSIVTAVMSWLITRPNAPRKAPRPTLMLQTMRKFAAELRAERSEWRGRRPPWDYVLKTARRVARAAGFAAG